MIARMMKRVCLVGVCATLLGGAAAAPALAAPSDPLWVFTPTPGTGSTSPKPLPRGTLYGPCGLGINSAGDFYVSDYYHNVIDVYEPNADYSATKPRPTGATGFLGQIGGTDPFSGPCALALDASDTLYANVFHRSVVKYGSGGPSLIDGQGLYPSRPTGVAVDTATGLVYVDDRTYVAVYDSSGSSVMNVGSFDNGYGVAVSQFPGTAGRVYVPDAATNTVKVYDPAVSTVNPVQTIDGGDTPPGEFVSLRDASVAVDRVSGEIYVVDNLQPVDTERPQAIIDVFAADGSYEGHLKFLVVDGLPTGLAVDNSPSATHPVGTQGRIYVTWGNTEVGAIYAYPPGAATTAPIKLPTAQLALASVGGGAGTLSMEPGELECNDTCSQSLPAGSTVELEARPASGSTFAGWSGSCSGTESSCVVKVEQAATVRAKFDQEIPPQPSGADSAGPVPSGAAATRHRRRRHHHRRHGHRRVRHHQADGRAGGNR